VKRKTGGAPQYLLVNRVHSYMEWVEDNNIT